MTAPTRSAAEAPPDAEGDRGTPGWLRVGGIPCLAWWHRPDPDAATGWGVVVCPPVGFEHQGMHRALRVLARRAAAQGHAVLRLDYPGTGNSAGEDGGPEDWAGWVASVRAAAAALRAEAGVTRVCLAGVQLGGTLAALACADDEAGAPVADALALVAPVVQGRAWLRERRALLGTMGRTDGAAASSSGMAAGAEEAGGVVFAEGTRAALGAVQLATLSGALPPHVLLVDREDRPPSDAVTGAWGARGMAVTHRRLPGYDLLLRDAHEGAIPEALWGPVLGWLAALPPVDAWRSPADGGAPARDDGDAVVAEGIVERPLFLDDEARLFGVLSRPAVPPDRRRVMLILNAGANPHVGFGRLHVLVARRLAAAGWMAVRVDLGGLGESLPHPGIPEQTVYPATAVGDVATVVRHARERLGAERVEAMGVCAGAYHAFKAAVVGAPLDAVTVVNPLVFFWKPGTSLALPPYRAAQAVAGYGHAVRSAEKWRKLLRGEVAVREIVAVLSRHAVTRARELLREGARLVRWPLREDLAQELAQVAARGVAVRFLFSVGDPGEALLRRGAGRTLARLVRRGAVSVRHLPECDHSFSRAWMREALWARLAALGE